MQLLATAPFKLFDELTDTLGWKEGYTSRMEQELEMRAKLSPKEKDAKATAQDMATLNGWKFIQETARRNLSRWKEQQRMVCKLC